MPEGPVPTDSQSCAVHFRLSERPIAFQSSQFDVPLQQCIYQGPYSDVYCARLNAFDPPELVAVKGIRSMNEKDPNQFVQNELRIWRLLNDHPHIVHFLGVASLDQWPGLYTPPLAVCRYYHEGSPRQFIRKRNPTCMLRLELLTGIIRGLDHIHQQSVVHGDLKGANILVEVTIDGQYLAKITDFGSSSLSCPCHKNLDNPIGTQQWDSPEVRTGESPRTTSSDVWAFGCVAMEIQMDTLPYAKKNNPNSSNIRNVVVRQLRGELPAGSKSDCNRDPTGQPVSEAVWEITQKCWERIPADRPTVSTLLKQLEDIRTPVQLVASDVHTALNQLQLTHEPVFVRQ